MPYQIIKNRGKSTFRVINKITKQVHSKSSSLINAKRQVRLLEAIEHNPNYK